MGVTSITYGGANATATASPIDSDHQSFQAPSPAMLTFYVALGLVGYVSLCSALRFRRINRLQAKYKYTSRDSLASMTVEDAQVITNYMIKYEHTLFYDLALRLALLRVGHTFLHLPPTSRH